MTTFIDKFEFNFDQQFFENEKLDDSQIDVGAVLHIEVSPKPDWDNFKACAEQFIAVIEAEIKAVDYGMDRHQVDFELIGSRYLLQYEHYTQAVWVEVIS
jgi:hypothetical protein